ncbi:pantetheine-phosphate adenylyltransferase family protein [Talaromyces stipitatus ATCC 10500]|uniref:Pantetheine-phosphate adenylyltransferase family protein n=1 Tax=Talaromyces stipitatus (strain ATCC 10500 / CBS 375.48 / QM 6759 / NRRL 1006) TaxID=441959 RepID=B8MHV2_TALSN|nr:pantetheine-phosphate adenylyltransferase family protein [Talaromyces stipitatus ATCC 10500]EED16432.1 pantetheine-phosphate adenylyltransferase family protein [Talaromyces stipitatus ATCC 10500]
MSFQESILDLKTSNGAVNKEQCLLLLPAPPSPAVRQLKEVYGPALSHIFSSTAAELKGSSNIYKLDVALVIPQLLSAQYQPRSKAFVSLQKLLANFYTLVGAISAANDVELDAPGGIDVRVFFVDNAENEQTKDWKRIQGPVIDFRTLATSQRPWEQIYVPDTTEGELLAGTLFTHGASIPSNKLPTGTTTISESIINADEEHSTSHAAIIVGGTFDHLHLGHKLLLTATALALDGTRDDKILAVGITGDEMLVNKKFAEYLESWEERMQGTAAFLRAIVDFNPPEISSVDLKRTEQPGPNGKQVSFQVMPDLTVRLVQISDPFGPTITEEQFTALIVSAETRSGGQAVNTERNKKGWPSLEVFEVGVLQAGEAQEVADTAASSFESKISSTDIRQRRMKSATSNL